MSTPRTRFGVARALTLATLSCVVVACSGGATGKPNPSDSTPKAMKKDDAVAPTKVDGDASSSAAKRVKQANPHLAQAGNPRLGQAGNPPPPPSAPKKINFDGKTRRDIVDNLGYTVPTQWETQTPANRMRLAQYDLPGEGGGAALVLYRFPGGGGSVDDNVARWVTQFKQADGSDSNDKLEVTTTEAAPYKITRVELSGIYSAPAMGPGAKPEPPKPDTRMLAAIVEGDGNPFFFKVVGPATTVDAWTEAFDAMIKSFKQGE